MAVNISGLRRNIKNVAHNYTDAQVKVREATSNDPWGPSSTMMSEIADLTYNVVAFSEIMQMVWKRLNDNGKNWRHVYKALVLLEYLIKTGSEKVAQQCKENIFAIQTLKDFQYLDDNKDQGINVREKAKALVALLKDDERLRNERVRALKAKERFAQNTAGIGSDTVYTRTRERYDMTSAAAAGGAMPPHHRGGGGGGGGGEAEYQESLQNPEMEAARPQTAGEEELQLQLALAMSREEAEQEESKSKSDDMRLQLALQKSQEDDETKKKSAKPSNDLLDLDFGHSAGAAAGAVAAPPSASPQPPPPVRTEASLDPWGMPTQPPAPAAAAKNDPWGMPVQQQQQPPVVSVDGGGAAAALPTTNNDPWSPVQQQQQQPAPRVSPIPTLPGPSKSPVQQANNVADNDPWNRKPAPSDQQQLSASNGGAGAGPDSLDMFSPQVQNQLQEFDLLRTEIEAAGSGSESGHNNNNNNNGANSPNPFDMKDLDSGLLGAGGGVSQPLSSTGAKPKKSVHTMLGEHSNLVNLDNLVSDNQPARNPFEHQQQNPFQAKTTKPPLNELMQQNALPNTWGAASQQPMPSGFPQQDINPFS